MFRGLVLVLESKDSIVLDSRSLPVGRSSERLSGSVAVFYLHLNKLIFAKTTNITASHLQA